MRRGDHAAKISAREPRVLSAFEMLLEPEDAADRLHVRNPAVKGHADRFIKGDPVNLKVLAFVEMLILLGEIFGEKDHDVLGTVADGVVDEAKPRPCLRLYAALFEELAPGAVKLLFVGIDFARGKFPEALPERVTPLSFKQNRSILVERRHAAGAAVP